jgi:hypothetical protein
MPEIKLVFNGERGNAVERFAALAGKPVDQLILSWIEDKVDHAVVVSMRASGTTWEDVAAKLGVSITQARRIYAAGSEFQPVGKDDLKAAEKYLKVLGDIRDITSEGDIFPTPSQEDLDLLNEYVNALPDSDTIIPSVGQEDLDLLNEYVNALPDPDTIFPVPSEEDVEAVERYAKATRKK